MGGSSSSRGGRRSPDGGRLRRRLPRWAAVGLLLVVAVFAVVRVAPFLQEDGGFGPPKTVGWRSAGEYLGERVTIEGPVVSTHWARDSQGQPTFLNIGRDYPHPDRVTVFIPGEYRSRFPSVPEDLFLGEQVRVTGDLQEYEDAVEIKVSSPAQIEVIR